MGEGVPTAAARMEDAEPGREGRARGRQGKSSLWRSYLLNEDGK